MNKTTNKMNTAAIGAAVFLAAGTAGVPTASAQQSADTDSRPNLLFIFADQYRRASLGFLGEDPVNTPNIDALARDGVFFSRAVSNHPLSTPFRGMLLTGKYPLSSGIITNCCSLPERADNYLKPEEVCFTDVLADGGYSVGYVGKWHLDAPATTAKGEEVIWDTWCPPDRRHGVDFWYSYGADNSHMSPHYWANDTPEDKPIQIQGKWSPEHEADLIIDYIADNASQMRDSSKPFAMFWSINPPHTPFMEMPDKYSQAYDGITAEQVLNRPNVLYTDNTDLPIGGAGQVERTLHEAPYYFAAVCGVDDQVGRVMRALDEAGLTDNTIVVFCSDHGEMLGSQGLMHKNYWFAESYDIPLIVRWPAAVQPGTDDLLISVPDYMPTFLGLMGLRENVPQAIDGRDYSAVMLGGEVERPDCQLYFGTEPTRKDYGKRGIRTDRYTFAVFKDRKKGKQFFLYDNIADPYQMRNIWGEDKEVDTMVENRLHDLLRDMNDPWVE